MFSLEIIRPTTNDPNLDALAKIRIGDFSEDFGVCYFSGGKGSTVEQWRHELQKLCDGAKFAAIHHQPLMAWVLYRDGHDVAIQQHLLVEGWEGKIDESSRIIDVPPLRHTCVDGEKISEWRTTLNAVQQFLGTQPD